MSFLVTSNALRLTDDGLRSNTYLTIATRPADGRDALELQRALSLNDQQTAYLTSMPRGEVMLRLPRVPHPILAVFDPITIAHNTTAYNTAIATTNEYLQSLRVQPTPALPPASAPEKEALALNTRQRNILQYIGTRGITTTLDVHTALKLKPEQARRAIRPLLNLGLVQQHDIRVHARRGSAATALTITNTAYQLLNMRRPQLGRGGAQHQWLVRQLRDVIPEVAIELAHADLTFLFDAQKHANVQTALNTLCNLSLNTGDVVAIEVDLLPSKTSRANLARNTGTTILAVLPEQLTTARQLSHNSVDVFAFLDHLKGKQ